MFSKIVKSVLVLSVLNAFQHVQAAEVHGSGAEGTVMGPVAFLWPEDRPWSANADNSGPCGSSAGITNRTEFPLGSIGSIELTIASEAYNVAVRIAYGNNPTTQDVFSQIQSNVSELDPGHQCYSVPNEASTAGTNATIQLEYWANDSNKNESFFACADITFVEAELFTTQIPCFNVTSAEFESPTTDPSTTPSTEIPVETGAATDDGEVVPVSSKGENSGLSTGAKAGIAVSSIVGAALIVAAIFFALRRRGQKSKAVVEVSPQSEMRKETASFHSGETMH